MESWLIFPHHVRLVCTMQGRRKVVTQVYGMSCETFQGWSPGKSGGRESKNRDEKP